MKHESIVKADDIHCGAIILESEYNEECIDKLIAMEMEDSVKTHADKKNDLRKVGCVKL